METKFSMIGNMAFDPKDLQTQLVTIIHELGKNLDNRKQTDITVFDITAFDKVSHQLLFIRLDHYGIRGSTLRLINFFLSDCTQKVILEGAVSDT